ncbi:MAG: SOS response-associated peptidase [Dehalococcoidia bacterium]|nr:SOS response-associated peptidase [Dehalococcoidia bacterium]
MCGRFTLTPENEDFVAAALGIPTSELFDDRYEPTYNRAPMQEHWIATDQREQRVPQLATWGLVNWWEPDRRSGAKHINVRAETVETTKVSRDAFVTGRCIVPADGFYEWTGEAKSRRPFWFHRPDDEVFAFAGLHVTTRLRGEPAPATTFTIITTRANGLVGNIHDRMPVILPDAEAVDAWLHAEEPIERLKALLRPVEDGFLVARPVTQRVNSVKHDDPACLEEAEPETQGSLL